MYAVRIQQFSTWIWALSPGHWLFKTLRTLSARGKLSPSSSSLKMNHKFMQSTRKLAESSSNGGWKEQRKRSRSVLSVDYVMDTKVLKMRENCWSKTNPAMLHRSLSTFSWRNRETQQLTVQEQNSKLRKLARKETRGGEEKATQTITIKNSTILNSTWIVFSWMKWEREGEWIEGWKVKSELEIILQNSIRKQTFIISAELAESQSVGAGNEKYDTNHNH